MNPEDKTESQKATGEALEQGEKDSKGMAAGIAGSALAATPAGRLAKLAGLASRNKKGIAIGTTILVVIVTIVFSFVLTTSSTIIIWMASIFGDINFGDFDRRTSGRFNRIIRDIDTIRDTEAGRKVRTSPATEAGLKNVDAEMAKRGNRRLYMRPEITRKSGGLTARSWRFFRGRPPDASGGQSASDRMRGKGRMNRSGGDAPPRIQEVVDETRAAPANEKSTTFRRGIRRVAGGSAVGLGMVVGCLSSMYEGLEPDEREKYLMILGAGVDILTASSQLMQGKDIDMEELDDLMTAYMDTYEAGDLDESLGDELIQDDEVVHRGFWDSAAWKRATNEPLQGDEEDIDLKYGEEHGLVESGALALGGALNSTAAEALLNPFTFFSDQALQLIFEDWKSNNLKVSDICGGLMTPGVGEVLSIAEFAVSLGAGRVVSFLVSEAALYGVSYSLSNALSFGEPFPDSPAMVTGNNDMGLNLMNSENARSQGALPISSSAANQQRQAYLDDLAQENLEKGFAWRYFSLDNPRSAVAKIAMRNTLSPQNLLRSIVSIPANLPKTIAGAFTQRVNANEHFNNHGIRQFSFPDDVLDISPEEAADYVETRIGYECTEGEDEEGNVVHLGPNQSTCDEDRWEEAVIIEAIIAGCMTEPYWVMEENSWESRYRHPVTNQRLKINCSGPSGSHRYIWERVGLWKFDLDLVDTGVCLSHDQPCERENVLDENHRTVVVERIKEERGEI